MDFVIGAAVAALVIAAIFGYKKNIIDRFRYLEEDIDDINELVAEVVAFGGDE